MYEKELFFAKKACKNASKVILDIYSKNITFDLKSDNSPVTEADKKSDILIRNLLSQNFSYSFLTEESEDDLKRLDDDYVWIVDPLDGTKDFIARDGDFTTNIALSYKHDIVLGVVLVHLTGDIYFAVKGQGAYVEHSNGVIERIHVNNKLKDLTVLISVFHFNELEREMINKHSGTIRHIQKCGSSMKACKIASGEAELSYRFFGHTKEWDTAAPQIIVEEAGGIFLKPNGDKMKYNRRDVYNREGYIIANRLENLLL